MLVRWFSICLRVLTSFSSEARKWGQYVLPQELCSGPLHWEHHRRFAATVQHHIQGCNKTTTSPGCAPASASSVHLVPYMFTPPLFMYNICKTYFQLCLSKLPSRSHSKNLFVFDAASPGASHSHDFSYHLIQSVIHFFVTVVCHVSHVLCQLTQSVIHIFVTVAKERSQLKRRFYITVR